MTRDQVFISYSHADSDWLKRLRIMLTPLQRQGMLKVWADTDITPGQLWKEEIQQALARAKVAVLLVSPDFLASEFIDKDELPPLLEASRKEGLRILWIPVRPSLYKATAIAHFQAAYDPKTPLSTLPLAQQEVELVHIAEMLMAVRPLPSSPPLPPLTSIPPSAEQRAQSPSPSPRSPSSSSAAPSGPSIPPSPQRVWGQLLMVLVLGVLGGAGVYHLGKAWFEERPVSNSSVSRGSAQEHDPAQSTEPKTSTSTVSAPSQQDLVTKAPTRPLIQAVHGWSAPQVQALQQQTAKALKVNVEFQDTLKDGGQGPLMVVIPAGRFQMGSPDTELERASDEQQHEVEVAAFAIGKYEVTVGQFKRFVEIAQYKTEVEKSGGCYVWTESGWKQDPDKNWRNPGFSQTDNHPVVCVSWNDATEYVNWLSKQTGKQYHLPTEAEWEYAARAGAATPFYFGATLSTDQANYNGNYVYDGGHKGEYRQKTVEVGYFSPRAANAWGLHDMHGNVWEWTCSVYDKNYGGSEQRCAEPGVGGPRVLRGGAWTSEPLGLRGAARPGGDPRVRINDGGFRLARIFSL